jgi:hypothetical protein
MNPTNRATPKMRDFAERLIACETRGIKPSRIKSRAIFLVCEKLRPPLSMLMGNTGFSSLLARSHTLASAEVPWLRSVQVKADGSIGEWDELEAKVTPERILEGRIVLLAQLLGLMVAFIGENLTLGLVQEVWPKLSLHNLDFEKGDKNEETIRHG